MIENEIKDGGLQSIAVSTCPRFYLPEGDRPERREHFA